MPLASPMPETSRPPGGCTACEVVGPILTGEGSSGRSWRCTGCGQLWDGDPQGPAPHGHTRRDHAELVAAGFDPEATQPREHGVRCWCGEPTRHQMGGCDAEGHYVRPGRCADGDALAASVCRHPAGAVA